MCEARTITFPGDSLNLINGFGSAERLALCQQQPVFLLALFVLRPGALNSASSPMLCTPLAAAPFFSFVRSVTVCNGAEMDRVVKSRFDDTWYNGPIITQCAASTIGNLITLKIVRPILTKTLSAVLLYISSLRFCCAAGGVLCSTCNCGAPPVASVSVSQQQTGIIDYCTIPTLVLYTVVYRYTSTTCAGPVVTLAIPPAV